MSITLVCECGRRLDFKDEYAGRKVRCPDCDIINTVGPADAAASASGDPVFDREKFLLKQRVMTVNQRYDVADESGQTILFVERPTFMIRNLAALGVALVVGFLVFSGFSSFLPDSDVVSTAADVLAVTGVFVAFVAFGVVVTMLAPKRHVTFYRDANSRERVLEVLQDKKWQPITATFTVRDAAGNVIALLRKNYLFNLFRKRWVCLTPSGGMMMMAKEDSIILSLLRRLLGPLFGLLRAQYIFTRGESDVVIGEFNRKLTLLDRYVLDMTRDARRVIDRRVALALGVMLDSGERR
ncbi:MAG: hypothetical protein ACYC0B_08355 [Gemmatimonadaceae bacterium]